VLRAENAECGYGSRQVLFGIDLSINKGEFAGVIGPNGSGKTTLLRLLSKGIVPQKGKVTLRGKDLKDIPAKEFAREIAVVSQNQPVNNMTVSQFVSLGRIPHHDRLQFFDSIKDREAVGKAMILTDTEKFSDRTLGQMSGGERQLVFIARALAQEPRILLLDEPTTHLDITHQIMVLDLIRRLNSDLGLTVIMILHDLNLAAQYCRRLILIEKGRIHSDGEPSQVLSYDTIEAVYRTIVVVGKNPISAQPYVMPVAEHERTEK
jgi:iron complex transport system ATP-binding protein